MNTEKNPVTLCEEDFNLLKDLVGGSASSEVSNEMSLANEISRATVVKNGDLPPHTVRINSKVCVQDIQSKRATELTIVMPRYADIKQKKISILTPMAAALIGFRKGDEVEWKMPSGLKKYKLLEVHNPVENTYVV